MNFMILVEEPQDHFDHSGRALFAYDRERYSRGPRRMGFGCGPRVQDHCRWRDSIFHSQCDWYNCWKPERYASRITADIGNHDQFQRK